MQASSVSVFTNMIEKYLVGASYTYRDIILHVNSYSAKGFLVRLRCCFNDNLVFNLKLLLSLE